MKMNDMKLFPMDSIFFHEMRRTPVRRYAVIFIIVFTLLSSFVSARAQDNPFEPAAQQNYSGRFRGAEVELRLKQTFAVRCPKSH